MPQIIRCPDCGRKLRVPDNLLGKKVKCPSCGVKFVGEAEEGLDELEEVEEPAPPPSRRRRDERVVEKPSKSRRPEDEEVDEDDVPAKRRRREEEPDDDDVEPQKRKPKKRDIYKGWERVRFGVNLVAVSIWIFVGGYIALFGLTIVLGNLTREAPAAQEFMAFLILILGGLVSLASLGSQVAGFGFCMGVVSTPRTRTLKILAVATFSLSVAILILQVLYIAAGRILGPSGAIVLVAGFWLDLLLGAGAAVCFLFFMRGVAVVMRRDDLVRAITVYMITLAVIFGLSVAASLILTLAGQLAAITVAPNPAGPSGGAPNMAGVAVVGCLIMVVLFGVSLTLVIRFVLLLYQVRSAVDRWLNRN